MVWQQHELHIYLVDKKYSNYLNDQHKNEQYYTAYETVDSKLTKDGNGVIAGRGRDWKGKGYIFYIQAELRVGGGEENVIHSQTKAVLITSHSIT